IGGGTFSGGGDGGVRFRGGADGIRVAPAGRRDRGSTRWTFGAVGIPGGAVPGGNGGEPLDDLHGGESAAGVRIGRWRVWRQGDGAAAVAHRGSGGAAVGNDGARASSSSSTEAFAPALGFRVGAVDP